MLKQLAMAAWGGDSCNSSLKMLQATFNDYNVSSYPIISSIEAMSCEVFVAHQWIYVKCVSIIVYVYSFFIGQKHYPPQMSTYVFLRILTFPSSIPQFTKK